MRILLLIVSAMMLIACSDNTSKSTVDLSSDDVEQKETEQEEEKNVNMHEEGETDDTEEETSPAFTIDSSNWTLQPTEETDQKYVLLTIDDAPDTYALDMARILAEEKVPAIFFVNGHFLSDEDQMEALKEIARLGFEIGNHTMTHANLSELSTEETEQEILQLNELIKDITGEKPQFFRAPFGMNTDASKEILAREGMIWMNWTYGYDWEKEFMEKEPLADIMVNTDHLVNGANLLMHDREWTKEALPQIISGLREKGYEFVDPSMIETTE
ncbi:polysaccharide deacetylase family protein [Aliibacillus thermotolerans]|uniref:Polysaccharide deacetylase family protein n=1 Tax=Aliibacillus thermotolerans TaxID=1834418 RepID=A0ABW0U4V0_9BACI